jgi:hypothetical protein
MLWFVLLVGKQQQIRIFSPMIFSLIRGVGRISVLLFLVRKRECSLRALLLLITVARNKTFFKK